MMPASPAEKPLVFAHRSLNTRFKKGVLQDRLPVIISYLSAQPLKD
jgi:hypothetical protein